MTDYIFLEGFEVYEDPEILDHENPKNFEDIETPENFKNRGDNEV